MRLPAVVGIDEIATIILIIFYLLPMLALIRLNGVDTNVGEL